MIQQDLATIESDQQDLNTESFISIKCCYVETSVNILMKRRKHATDTNFTSFLTIFLKCIEYELSEACKKTGNGNEMLINSKKRIFTSFFDLFFLFFIHIFIVGGSIKHYLFFFP